jgi:acetyltransferase-like isoleucine patch superfamily enzyme
MNKSLSRRFANRVLHILARHGPGSTGLRPLLHRLRGVKVGRNVFIGDEVYLENEYPEAVEIQDGAQISVRAIIIAHTHGPGKVIIEKDAFIGPNVVITISGGRVLRIGEGAVIGAGVVIARDVPPHMFIANVSNQVVAKALVPLTKAEKVEDFIRGLVPIKSKARSDRSKK